MKASVFITQILVSMLISCGKIPSYDCMGRANFQTTSLIGSERAKRISDILCNYIDREKVPGIQLTIIDSMGKAWSISTGTIDTKRKHAVTNDHLMRMASITKTFTASVIFTLIDQGKLSLDDKLIAYFPEFTEAPNVTIKNLLNHSSGVKELLTLPDILTNSTLFTTKVWDVNSIIKTISKKKLVFQTGSDFQYSNTNYVLLGLIAEKITHKGMAELYREYLFNPLNIDKLALVPQQKPLQH